MKIVQLYLEQTRYVMKYRHCDGKLVLKVTDNQQVLVHFSKTKKFKYYIYGLIIDLFWNCLCMFESENMDRHDIII